MKKHSFISKAFFLILSMGLIAYAGCGGVGENDDKSSPEDPPPEIKIIRSEKPRSASPGASEIELHELVAGNTDFALDLYHALSKDDGNIFFSPYSISLALAMTYAGAENDTENQMQDTLHFTLYRDRLHPAFNALDIELASRDKTSGNQNGFRLNIANSVWGQTGYSFLPLFLDVLAENYGAGLRVLDFKKYPADSRILINNWVSDQTDGKIKNLIPAGVISSLTRLVLVNAIYFNAAWNRPFEKLLTENGSFFLLGSGKVTASVMSRRGYFAYTEGDGYQAVELKYNGDELSMVILLPESGEFTSFEDSLDSFKLDDILQNIRQRNENIRLRMPKFKYESASVSLKEILYAMGMSSAFTPCDNSTGTRCADFSGINGNRDLFIGDVIHKAFISVDEEGTEASAGTGVIMPPSAPPLMEVTIDRPFMFLIQDIETGAILFMGRMVNPAG